MMKWYAGAIVRRFINGREIFIREKKSPAFSTRRAVEAWIKENQDCYLVKLGAYPESALGKEVRSDGTET